MNDTIIKDLLETIADITGEVKGAYNLRSNGCGVERRSSENIKITPKEDKPGIDINVKPNTKGEMVHIPVVITEDNINDLVYNDFYIGENADVTIVAGCGIHNDGCGTSEHDGIHTFYIGKNAKVKYVEKHYGEGSVQSTKILNPTTIVHMEENSYCEMEMTQIKGVNSTQRETEANIGKDGKLVINEKLIIQFPINRDGNVKQHYYRNENNDYHFITTVIRHVFYFRIHIAAPPKNILSRKTEKLNPLIYA